MEDNLPLRILLVDDFPAVRRALRGLLEAHPGWEVVAEAADGNEGLREAIREQPDVAIVDVAMPGMNGLELTRALRKSLPQTAILILTQYNSPRMLDEARDAGALGFVTKSEAGLRLFSAIQAVSENRTFFGSDEHDR